MNPPSLLRLGIATLGFSGPLLIAGCGGGPGAEDGLDVVTGFYALEYVAGRVAGDHAAVSALTAPGQEPHDVELPLSKTAEVSDADLVVYEAGFQAAVDEAVETAGPEHVVDAAVAAELVTRDGSQDPDPHFWLDPTRLGAVAEAVRDALVEVDPDNADDYDASTAELVRDLEELDSAYTEGLASCAIDTVVVSHDAFGYLGDRYGLEIHSIAGLSPDAEPSPARLRELHDLAGRAGITTVFSEELVSPELAEALAGDLGLRSAVLDPIEGLSDATADEDYLSLMERNLATLRKANDCT